MRKAGLHVEPHADRSLIDVAGRAGPRHGPGGRRRRDPGTDPRRDPAGADGQQELAETLGGVPNDFELAL